MLPTGAHCERDYAELRGDLLIVAPGGDKTDDLALARRQKGMAGAEFIILCMPVARRACLANLQTGREWPTALLITMSTAPAIGMLTAIATLLIHGTISRGTIALLPRCREERLLFSI
jgi:hypothetical protein